MSFNVTPWNRRHLHGCFLHRPCASGEWGSTKTPDVKKTPVKVGKSSGHLRILPHLKNGNDFFNEHQHHPFFKICHSNRDRPRSSWRSVPIAAGVSGLVEAGILAADQRIFMDERIGFGEDQWRFGQGIFMIYSWWFWFRHLKWPHELIFFWLMPT